MLTHRTYKIGRLYFRYLANTHAEKNGWSGEALASILEKKGYIKVVEIQGYDKKGRWTEKVRRYYELKPISQKTVLDAMKGMNK